MKRKLTRAGAVVAATAAALVVVSAPASASTNGCWDGALGGPQICLKIYGSEGGREYVGELEGTVDGSDVGTPGHFEFRWRSGNRDWYKSTPDAAGTRTEKVSVNVWTDPNTYKCVRFWVQDRDSYRLRNDWHCLDGK